MVDKNDSLSREIDEELRREKLEKLWEQYGTYVLGAAAALVIAVGGYQLYDQRKKSFAAENGARYDAAVTLLEQSKTDEAQKALSEVLASGHAGYASLAQLQLAGIHLKANRPQDALAVFEALATSSSADADIKTFALLQAAALRLGQADFTELQNRLKPVAEGSTAWRFQARELLGTAAFKAGKFDDARAQLTPLLADPETPRAALDRIQLILAAMASADAGKAAAGPAATAPQTPAKEQTTTPPAETPAQGGK
ncbi:MAG TPA: tetratricopeptide repeat protein [Hyphomicrobium sp.]|nr:tetratricopeptide repeat protein [Hyphomicrobium sp.]